MRIIFIFFISVLICSEAKAQPALPDSFAYHNFSITYDINIISNKKRSIAETYNGAVKTVYVKDNAVRLRLVSLMRIQNVYFHHNSADTNSVAIITKESGKSKYKFRLNASNWKLFNAKYDSVKVELIEDSLVILNRVCKKALLTLNNDVKLTAYYLPAVKNEALMAAEPMFAGLPGIVLQYEYHEGKKAILYTAADVSFAPLPAAVFAVPAKGYPAKKFSPGKTFKGNIPDEDEE